MVLVFVNIYSKQMKQYATALWNKQCHQWHKMQIHVFHRILKYKLYSRITIGILPLTNTSASLFFLVGVHHF